MRIIAINGPKESGKTTFALALEDELKKLDPAITVIQGHFKEPLITMLETMHKFAHPLDSNMTYSKLKDESIFGHTGREWQVAIAQGMKNLDPAILPKILFNSIDMTRDDVLIIDDLGTEREYQSLTFVPHASAVHIVYMETRGDRLYGHGHNFGDNRISLRGYAGAIDPSPEDYARKYLGFPDLTDESGVAATLGEPTEGTKATQAEPQLKAGDAGERGEIA